MFSTDAETSGYRIKVLQLRRTFLLPVGAEGVAGETEAHSTQQHSLKGATSHTAAMTVKPLLTCG